jgi:Secretion system C-terminal sorting domain
MNSINWQKSRAENCSLFNLYFMKKYILLLQVVLFLSGYNSLIAQCNVTNVIISNVRTTPSGSDSLIYTIDLQFNATVNGGNKDVWLHVWREADYPATTMQRYNCTQHQSTAPAPSTFTDGNNNLDVLDKAFLTFGFDDNAIGTNIPGTTGIFTGYHYDAAITPNYTGTTIYKITHATDPNVDHVYIQDVSFKVSNNAIDFLQVRAFSWSTVGDQRPQCWGCGETFVVGDPVVFGSINCTATRTYNLSIQSKFDDVTVPGIENIAGYYRLYIDVDRNGSINEDIDILAQTNTNFNTGFEPGTILPGFKSAYVGSVLSFNNYTFQNGDTNSNKPLIALVNVTTPGYLGAGATGILNNPCTVLPVEMLSFKIQRIVNNVDLTWQTAQEFNFSGFDVQRKIDKAGFASIGFVAAKASDGAGATYNFTDADLPPGTNVWYRLRIVDKDGGQMYSDIRAIRNNAKKMEVSIYPNPNSGFFAIAIPSDAGLYDLIVTDIAGRTLKSMNGLRSQSLQMNSLNPGIYIIKIWFRETGEIVSERIVVK